MAIFLSKIVHHDFIREIAMFSSRLLSFDKFFVHHESIGTLSTQFSTRTQANPGEVSTDSNSTTKHLNLILNTNPRILAP